jgi:predicted TIM-barrel fold metal-dependent hydrolase
MDYSSVKINNYKELVKLPWFELRGDGRLTLKQDSGVPPILDVHTHFGWSYFGGRVVPYDTLHQDEAQQYYDYSSNPVNLDKDEHPLKSEADGITVDIALIIARCPPKARTQTAANMLEEMDRFNTVASVVLPIEIPLRSRHAFQTVSTCKKHERLIAFAGVHPWTRWKKLRLDWQISQGVLGLKYHPEFQFCPPDTRGALDLFAMCRDAGLVIQAHSGATGTEPGWMQKLSHPDRYRKAVEQFPDLKIILAHTAIIHYKAAVAMAREYENVFVDTSGQGVPVLREIFDEVPRHKILYGSDWSFFPLGVPIARSMAALDGYPEDFKQDYFYRNACRLLGLDAAAFANGRVVKA